MPETQVVAALEKNKYYQHTDLFYVNRHSFWEAGQDSWTLPPAQHQDAFMQLTNVEPVLRGVLQRRRGYTLFSSQAPSTPYTLGYSFRSDLLGLRDVVFTSTSNVLVTSEAGQVLSSSLFTPSANAVRPRMVLSRDYGYFADTILADAKKFDGTQNAGNLTKWGIDINDIGALVFGPNDATVAADQGTGGGTANQGPLNCQTGSQFLAGSLWTNPNNIAVSGQNANVNLGSNTNTRFLSASNFGFSIPSNATITGIVITFRKQDDDGSGQVVDNGVFLQKLSGATVGTDHSVGTPWPGTVATTSYGNTTDLWGTTWTPAEINASTFGAAIEAMNNDASISHNIRVFAFVTATVYYTTPAAASWSNVNGSFGNNPASPATATASIASSSDLRNTGFGFAVSGNAIVGIKVAITCKVSSGSVNLNPILVKAGTAVGSRKTVAVTNTTFSTVTFGSSTDLWNASWLAADVNAATFGVQYNVSTSSGSSTFSVDRVQITINTAAGPITLGATAAGSITLLNGRTYFYVFQNSKTGHSSGLSPASASTGPLTAKNQPLASIPTSADSQVDTVTLLATADGNDQTTLYLLVSLSNGTATYTDNTPDSTLITQAVYLNTDSFGVIHGVANNNPPSAINFPTKHKGRLYGAVGRALFFSKNLDEVTTANGLITGKWEESWPATNQFDISEQAETIQGLLSDGETLWIGTERGIRRLIGDSPNNFQKPEVQFNEAGLLNQDVWKIVFHEGQPTGTIWLTPDLRVMGSDFNTYLDIGTPVQDVLNSINISAVQTAHASFVSKGPADYYMLYIPTGSNTQPDTCLVLNLRSKKWFVWQPTDRVTASLFFIDGNGNPRWLFAANAGSLYEWTFNTFQDRIGNTPVTYPVTIQTSWLDMGDYNIRKFLNQIVPTTADQSALTIGVEGASNEQDFTTPLIVVSPTAVVPAAIPTDVFVPLASGPSHNRAFRFTFVSPPSTIQNVLTGFAVEAGQFHRY